MKLRELRAARITDLMEGGKKMFSFQGHDILLTKVNGKIHAVAGHCTHYGAPLDEGILQGDRVICPWHHAIFNVVTGDLQDPPALDALPSYEVKIEGEDILVLLPEKIESNRLSSMVKHDRDADSRCFVIIGAGAAGYAAAQTLRENGFRGRLIMITHEAQPTYDRPTLSKAYLQGSMERESLPLRPDKFYRDHDIELRLNRRVDDVDTRSKTVKINGGETLRYDKLVIASGGTPRSLDVPGAELGNVFLLRSLSDCEAIIAALNEARHAVVVGSSFIGLESTASMIKRKKIPVTIISPESIPFEKVFGPEIGALVRNLHEKNGATFKLGRSVQKFEGKDKVQAVILDDGQRLEADLVIVGIGVRPATDFLHDLPKQPDGSLKVDRFFRVNEDVYAVGDVAMFTDWRTGADIRIEHWRTALQQGRHAADHITGKETPYEGLPFFWTSQVGLGLRYVGYCKHWDETIIQGSISSQEFVVFYVKDNRVLAAAGNKRDKFMDAVHLLMLANRMPSGNELRANPEMDLIGMIESENASV
jgi:NADPH-dependent 2,4-dienoyl-CoA reductase/sulfur reductase-like enzyme/nitrite reductase/ring-hydroxylating ferredoxin subunit